MQHRRQQKRRRRCPILRHESVVEHLGKLVVVLLAVSLVGCCCCRRLSCCYCRCCCNAAHVGVFFPFSQRPHSLTGSRASRTRILLFVHFARSISNELQVNKHSSSVTQLNHTKKIAKSRRGLTNKTTKESREKKKKKSLISSGKSE